MAQSSSLLSEDQFLCPICLDILTKPVSTPCGHNFCMSCISCCWNSTSVCQCPICKESFTRRPNLKVNTFISELAANFKTLHVSAASIQHGGNVVLCHLCGDDHTAAVKSCLNCFLSYCGSHVQSHDNSPDLKWHRMVEPLENIDQKVCKNHHLLLEYFCKDERSLLCDLCIPAHNNHQVVPAQWGYEEMQEELAKDKARIHRMIQERLQKVQSTRESVNQGEAETAEVMECSSRGLTELVLEIKKMQAELIKVVEEKNKAAKEQAEGFIRDMEKEISDLRKTAKDLEKRRDTEDEICFLQSCSEQSLILHTMDLPAFSFNRHLEIQHMHDSLKDSLSQLWEVLSKIKHEMNKFSSSTEASDEVMLRYMQQFEVNVLLDPDSAHPLLSLSDDRKQVRYSTSVGLWGERVVKPKAFTEQLAVLGHDGFVSCKFYFEVLVGQKTEWCLGVATASIQRNGPLIRTPQGGLWAIWFLLDHFETFSAPDVTMYVGKVERVGVFVDYEFGEISFFDVINATLIYSFKNCSFTEELYPYFNPCDDEYGSNRNPMIIVPVSY